MTSSSIRPVSRPPCTACRSNGSTPTALSPSSNCARARGHFESLRSFEQGVEYGGGAIANPCTTPPELLQRLPRLSAYADALARAAGFHAGPLVASTESPEAYMRLEGLRIVAGMAVYCVDQQSQITRASTLRSWAEQRLDRPTAFHAMYVDTTTPEAAPPDLATALEVSVALTRLQREAVRRSRVQPVTVVSGGPGTGSRTPSARSSATHWLGVNQCSWRRSPTRPLTR